MCELTIHSQRFDDARASCVYFSYHHIHYMRVVVVDEIELKARIGSYAELQLKMDFYTAMDDKFLKDSATAVRASMTRCSSDVFLYFMSRFTTG